jgi:hypothetical protein
MLRKFGFGCMKEFKRDGVELVTCEVCVERKQWRQGKKEMYEVCLFGFF